MHLDDALTRYACQLRANGRSEHTVLQVQRHVRLLARWLAAEKRSAMIGKIDDDTLALFLTSTTARLTRSRRPPFPSWRSTCRPGSRGSW